MKIKKTTFVQWAGVHSGGQPEPEHSLATMDTEYGQTDRHRAQGWASDTWALAVLMDGAHSSWRLMTTWETGQRVKRITGGMTSFVASSSPELVDSLVADTSSDLQRVWESSMSHYYQSSWKKKSKVIKATITMAGGSEWSVCVFGAQKDSAGWVSPSAVWTCRLFI